MIARKSFLILTSQFLSHVLGWVGLVLLAKLWGDFAPEALGVIGFAMSFVAIFDIFSGLGFASAHVKRVSEGKDLGTCIGTFSTIKLVMMPVMVSSILIFIFIWQNILKEEFYDSTTISVIFIFIGYYIFYNLQQIPSFTFQAKGEIAKRQIMQVFENIVKVPLIILVALAGISMLNIPPAIKWPDFLKPLQLFLADHVLGSLAMCYLFGIMTTFFIGLWFLRKYPIKRPNFDLFKNYFAFALPVMILSFISIISTNIDKIMIGFFWTSQEVGYYYAVQQVLEVIILISTSVSIVLFPTLSSYHASNNFVAIRKTTELAQRYTSMVTVPVMVVIIVLVYPIINIILSEDFLPAASVLIILTFFAFISALSMPYNSLITGMNRPIITAKIGIIICILNIVLNSLFIPEHGFLSFIGINGPQGAALATVIAFFVGFVALLYMSYKLAGTKIFQSFIFLHIISGAITGAVLYFVAYKTIFFTVFHWYHVIGLAFFSLGIYLAILYFMKEFKKQDFYFFLDLINPKKTFKYIFSELKEK